MIIVKILDDEKSLLSATDKQFIKNNFFFNTIEKWKSWVLKIEHYFRLLVFGHDYIFDKTKNLEYKVKTSDKIKDYQKNSIFHLM